MTPSRIHLASALCAAALTAGACAPTVELAPAPQVQSPKWRGIAPAGGTLLPQGLGTALGSAELQGLIDRGLAANADIGAARARIGQARAQLRIARAAMLPVVTASAGLNATQTDNEGGSVFNFSAASAGSDAPPLGRLHLRSRGHLDGGGTSPSRQRGCAEGGGEANSARGHPPAL